MIRTPPTLEKLRAFALGVMETGRQYLFDTKSLGGVIVLCDAADGFKDIIIFPEDLSHENSKDNLAGLVHSLIAKHGFFCVISMFDSFMIQGKDAEESLQILRLHKRGMSVSQIGATGLGTLCEQLSVTVETMTDSFSMFQSYQRAADKTVISFGPIVDQIGMDAGRFKFFGEQIDVEKKLEDSKHE
jgi:hypothetical protein